MKILAQLIRHQSRPEANEFSYCAIYEDELRRVWPKNEENRKAKIARFEFRLIYYTLGLCAMFVEDSSSGEARTRKKQRVITYYNESPAIGSIIQVLSAGRAGS